MLVKIHRRVKAEVTKFLLGRGFQPVSVPSGPRAHLALAFVGELKFDEGGEPVRIVIHDWDFCVPPSIYLTDSSSFRGTVHPHVGADGSICYRSEDENILNALAPASAVARCLVEAADVLARIRGAGAWAANEIQREFFAYWRGSTVLSCGLDYSVSKASVMDATDGSRLRAWVFQDEALARSIVDAMRLTPAGCNIDVVRLIETDVRLSVGSAGPPENTRTLLNWARDHSQVLYRAIVTVMTDKAYFKTRAPIIMIRAPNAEIGFAPLFADSMCCRYEKAPKTFIHHALNRHAPIPITRWTASDASPAFVHTRNGQPSLSTKRITLVGAGAIGGYLADNLARLGAGADGGELIIIDPQTLLPENIGRHRLGMDSVFKPKAEALAERLLSEFPWLNIRSRVADARTCSLFAGDLLIDATGAEALSRCINRTHWASWLNGCDPSPVLYCWVAGEGDGVQALWVEGRGAKACWECLNIHGKDGKFSARFPFVKHLTEFREVGCAAITPYAVGAAMNAASLASEMVCDWLTGKPDPRFRSRARTHGDVHRRPDASPERLAQCPVCSET